VALDLNLGFFATAFRRPRVELERACRDFLEEWDGRFLLLSTLRFEDGRSVPDALARVAGHPRKRLLQRVSYAIAARLARGTHPV
jgi:hypothetical protein